MANSIFQEFNCNTIQDILLQEKDFFDDTTLHFDKDFPVSTFNDTYLKPIDVSVLKEDDTVLIDDYSVLTALSSGDTVLMEDDTFLNRLMRLFLWMSL